MISSGVLIGALQGLFEWLPVSSEGAITAYKLLSGSSPVEAINFALWLHIGTFPCVLVVFRARIWEILVGFAKQPLNPTSIVRYLVISTMVSGLLGLFLVSTIEFSGAAGNTIMAIIGVLMLVTGFVQLRTKRMGLRGVTDLGLLDAVLAGLAQGFSVLPGLSRSGLTVAALLIRGVDRREALVLSFLMSVPASLGAALYVSARTSFEVSLSSVIAAFVAFAVGLLTIKLLTEFVAKINLGLFVFLVGLIMLLGSLWQSMA